MEEYLSRDLRFKVFRRPDYLPKGGNSCRNYAFQMSRGQFIQYLDSDDILHPNKLFIQIPYNLIDYGLVSFSNWEFFGSHNCNIHLNKYKYDGELNNSFDLLSELWKEQKFVPVFCFLIPRNLIVHEWKSYLLKNQDGDFFFRLLLNAKSVRFIGDAYGFYRIPRKFSVSGNTSLSAFRSDFATLLSYERILTDCSNDTIISGLINNYVHFVVRSIDVFPILAKMASRRVLVLDPNLKYVNLYKRYFYLYKIFGFEFSYWIRLRFVSLIRLIR